MSAKHKLVTGVEQYEYSHICERDLFGGEAYDETIKPSLMVEQNDEIYEMLTALETDFAMV